MVTTTSCCANGPSRDVQRMDADDSDKIESSKVGFTCCNIDDVSEPAMVEKENDSNDYRDSPGIENLPHGSESHHDAKFASEVDAANDFFPCYASGKTLPEVSAEGYQGLSQGQSYFKVGPVPEPPSEEELVAAMEELDSKRCLSPVHPYAN